MAVPTATSFLAPYANLGHPPTQGVRPSACGGTHGVETAARIHAPDSRRGRQCPLLIYLGPVDPELNNCR
jgi:hypothetical protein